MENRYWRSYRRSEEFQEEDIWNVIKGNNEADIQFEEPKAVIKPSISISRRLPSAERMIPGANKHEQYDCDEPKVMQHSAPVSIPDWPKIYGKGTVRKEDPAPSHYDNNCDIVFHDAVEESDGDEDDDENGDDDRLPPHEWLAKKYARSNISSFSVCEGAGRTLKGRDLSRVRNAVLSKTGFI